MPVLGLVAVLAACGGSSAPRSTASSLGLGVVGYAWGTGSLGSTGGAISAVPRNLPLPAGTTGLASGPGGLLALAAGRVWLSTGTPQTFYANSQAGFTRIAMPTPEQIIDVATGGDFALALAKDGHVYGWGQNDLGQLGDGTQTDRPEPVRVHLPGDARAASIAAGNHFALAVTSTGRVFTWGSNTTGQLGNGKTATLPTPVTVALPARPGDRIVSLAAGDRHVVALTKGGSVLTWGSNSVGQLGTGTAAPSARPAKVSLPQRAVSVEAGTAFTLAVLADGSVEAWGGNADGELGNATTTDSAKPVRVHLDGQPVASLDAADRFVVGVLRDGRLVAWGDNQFGQLGDGTTTDRHVPVRVALAAKVKISSVASGTGGAVAVADPAPVARLLVGPATDPGGPAGLVRPTGVVAGRRTAIRAVALDSLGRPLGVVPPGRLTLRIAAGRCTATGCTAAGAGLHELQATVPGASGTAMLAVLPASATVKSAGAATYSLPGSRSSRWWLWVLFGLVAAALIGVAVLAMRPYWTGRRTEA